MLLHDEIARQLEEYRAVLSRISELRRLESPQQAARELDQQFHHLCSLPRQDLFRLSNTELLARLARAGSAREVRLRVFGLVALLREDGELREAGGDEPSAQASRLRALELLLHTLARSEASDTPAFAPTVDGLLAALGNTPLPPEMHAALMHHFEAGGRFGRAEDMLHELLDQAPGVPELRRHGEDFYRRLLALNDETLQRGNFSRAEAEEGLTRLRGGTPV